MSKQAIDEANKPISVRLRPALLDALREVAARRGVNLSDLLREAAGSILCAEGLCTCPSCPQRHSAVGGNPEGRQ